MSDFDRFTEFLRREARTYRDPPPAPSESMWRGVEVGMAASATDALGYNEAPAAPRAEMWGRIEGALAVRGAEGGERPGAPGRWPSLRWRPGRGRVPGWAVAVAVAASLVLGLALGRLGRTSQPGEGAAGPEVATAPTGAVAPTETTAMVPQSGASTPTTAMVPQSVPTADPGETEPASAAVVLAHTALGATADAPRTADAPLFVAADPAAATATAASQPVPAQALAAEVAPSVRTAYVPVPFPTRRDNGTTRYLGRAEMLLTAFRTDQRTRASEQELARWARDLLIETRMQLELPVSRTPEELALLRDLEMVVLQMSRLGSGARDIEWQLTHESIELKDALPRLRAASATDGL